ncbi:MAG: hypothetical protein JKX85_00165 [Phycisphaeraceae bacterium]|nr:hypothetical protein [Phycisphaeraceae bacterium]
MAYPINLTEGKYIGGVLRGEILPELGYCRKVLAIKDAVAVDFGSVLHADTTAVAATDQITVLTFGGTPDAGTFAVGLNSEVTAALAFNVSTADLQTALEGLAGITAGDVVVTGTAGTTYTLTFASNLAAQAVAVEVDNAVTDTAVEVGLTLANSTEGVAAGATTLSTHDILNVAGDGALASAVALGRLLRLTPLAHASAWYVALLSLNKLN